ncbi:hypothetical protein DRP07_09320 [Archaeoglobales archaeon]|nr:MAG: hypothetical protein DRP07_09320 [Archaeoglobales archaeon]
MESIYSIALRIHLAIFLLINLILFLIDFLTAGGWWFYWITAVWLIALIFQAFASFKATKKESTTTVNTTLNTTINTKPLDENFWKLE